jgi:hypothetical protein
VEYITSERLSVLLGLQARTIKEWPARWKPLTSMSGRHRYDHVNAWLAEPGRAHGFTAPPTIEQIVAGEITFILRERAVRMVAGALGMSDASEYVYARARKGRLASLLLRTQTWVVSVASVQRLIHEALAAREFFGAEEINWIFGVGMSQSSTGVRVSTSFRALAKAGRVTLVRHPEDAKRLVLPRESALGLLRELLAAARSKVDPEDWIDDREASAEPLMTVPQVAARLGMTVEDVRRLLAKGEIHYIPSPDGNRLLASPDSVAFYQERMPALTDEQIGSVFGVQGRAVREWRDDGRLSCAIHSDQDVPCPMYRWCLVVYVKQRAGAGVHADRWVHNALSEQGLKLLTERSVGKILTPKRLKVGVESGRIPSVVSPSGRRVFAAFAVYGEAKRYA